MPTFLEQKSGIWSIDKRLICSAETQVSLNKRRFGNRLFQIWGCSRFLSWKSRKRQGNWKSKIWVKQKVSVVAKFLEVHISRHLIQIRRKKYMFLETKSGFVPIWFCLYSFPFGVPSAAPQSHRSPSMGTQPRLTPGCLHHTYPQWPKTGGDLREREKFGSQRRESRCSPSKGPDTRLPGERSPLPAMETMRPVRPQKVSGSTFRRGKNFHWSMVLATIISLLSEVIIIFYYCFRRLCFIRSGKSVYKHSCSRKINKQPSLL